MTSPKETSIDSLLDLWEDARQNQESLTAHEFIAELGERISPGVARELHEKNAAIEEMEKLLQQRVARPLNANAIEKGRREVALIPGLEPIRGYVLQSLLGSGGAGQVWKALGPGGYEVAMKFISLRNRNVHNEARSVNLAKGLRHDHILEVLGAWERFGYLIVATELADSSLFDRLQECLANGLAGIPRDELIGYIQQIAEGLDFLHHHRETPSSSGGFQHRDIKPQNLLLVGREVKIGDLGIARWVEKTETGHTGSMTVSYAAPEFFQGKTTQHSDQYSLAVTYYHLRTGSLPFQGTPLEVLRSHLDHEPDLSLLSQEEQQALSRAMSKEPSARWASCREFASALNGIALTKPSRPENKERSRNASHRKPFSRTFFIALAAIVLLVLGGMFWRFGTGNSGDSITSSQTTSVTSANGNSEDSNPVDSPAETEPSPQALPASPIPGISKSPNSTSVSPRVLIGLRLWEGAYGRGYRSRAVGGLQAIYAGNQGIEESHGNGYTVGEPTTIIAEPGYVIGQLELRWTNGRIGGILISFARLRQGYLDSSDQYAVEYQRRSILDAGIDEVETLGDLRHPFSDIRALAPNQELTRLTVFVYPGEVDEGIANLIESHALNERYAYGRPADERRPVLSREEMTSALDGLEPSAWQTELAERFDLPIELAGHAGIQYRLLPLLNRDQRPVGYLSTTPITVVQFREFVRATGYFTMAQAKDAGGEGIDWSTFELSRGKQFHWGNPGYFQTDDQPVVNVGYRDIETFCLWMTQQEGRLVRLPQAAELKGANGVGDRDESHDKVPTRNQFLPVAADLPANFWGFHGLSLGVREITATHFANPVDPREWHFNRRVLGGNSYLHEKTNRSQSPEPFVNDWDRHVDIGFRVLIPLDNE